MAKSMALYCAPQLRGLDPAPCPGAGVGAGDLPGPGVPHPTGPAGVHVLGNWEALGAVAVSAPHKLHSTQCHRLPTPVPGRVSASSGWWGGEDFWGCLMTMVTLTVACLQEPPSPWQHPTSGPIPADPSASSVSPPLASGSVRLSVRLQRTRQGCSLALVRVWSWQLGRADGVELARRGQPWAMPAGDGATGLAWQRCLAPGLARAPELAGAGSQLSDEVGSPEPQLHLACSGCQRCCFCPPHPTQLEALGKCGPLSPQHRATSCSEGRRCLCRVLWCSACSSHLVSLPLLPPYSSDLPPGVSALFLTTRIRWRISLTNWAIGSMILGWPGNNNPDYFHYWDLCL